MQTKGNTRPDGRDRGALARSHSILQCSSGEGHASAADAAPLGPRRGRATLAYRLATLTRRWLVFLGHTEPQSMTENRPGRSLPE